MTKAERRKVWESRIAAFQDSGSRMREWCRKNEVKEAAMYYWIKKFRDEKDAPKAPQWLPIDVSDKQKNSQSDDGLVIRIGQAEIVVNSCVDPELLGNVVRVLSQVC